MAITETKLTLINGTTLVQLNVPFTTPPSMGNIILGKPATNGATVTVNDTGGTIPDDTELWYIFIALASGKRGSMSQVLTARTAVSASNINSVVFDDIIFPSTAAQYEVYRSTTPYNFERIAGPTTIPATFTFTDTNLALDGTLLPDNTYKKARLYWKKTGDTTWIFATEGETSPLKFILPVNISAQSIDLKLHHVDHQNFENSDAEANTTTHVVTGNLGASIIGEDPSGTGWDVGMGSDFGGTDILGIRHGSSIVLAAPTPSSVNLLGGSITNLPASEVWGVDAPATEFVSKTTEFNDATSANFTPFTFAAAEAINDYCAFGSIRKFSKLTFDSLNGTTGIGGVVSWEYWNGTIWTALSGVTDGTSSFTAAVADGQDVTFTVPLDWATTTISTGAELFFVRAKVTTIYTTNPVYDQGFITPAGLSHGGIVIFNGDQRLDSPERNMAAHVSYRPHNPTNPLTGVGTTCNIAAFTMRAPGKDISINSGSVAGLTADTLYFIYYDDFGFLGGTVVFVAATTKSDAINNRNRFFVGSIRMPESGAADTTGNNDGGSGAQWGSVIKHSPTATQTSGTGEDTTLSNMVDKNWGTLGQKRYVGLDTENITGNIGAITFSPGGNQVGLRTVLRYRIKYQITAAIIFGTPVLTARVKVGTTTVQSVTRSTFGTTDSGVTTATGTISIATDLNALVVDGQIDFAGSAAGDRGTVTVKIYECEVIEEG